MKKYEVTVEVSYDDGLSRGEPVTVSRNQSSSFFARTDTSARKIATEILNNWKRLIGTRATDVGPIHRTVKDVKLVRLCEVTYRDIPLE